MATYDIDEARLVVPEGWEDRTLNTLSYPEKDGTLKVVMTRQQVRGRPLGKILDDLLVDMRRRLAGFELVSREEALVDGQPAFVVALRYRDESALLEQRTIWMMVGKKCVTVGVISSESKAPQAEATFAKIRSTISRRDRDADEAPAIEAASLPSATQQN